MLRRAAITFIVVLAVSPLMYVGSAFRQSNISGYPVFSKPSLIAAFPLFGTAFLVVFVGLCIPWDELADSSEKKTLTKKRSCRNLRGFDHPAEIKSDTSS